MIDPVLALLPLANSKQVKGLAVTTAKRTPLAPTYPTTAESGLAGMDHSSWYGVWGPKKLSADLVAQLNKMINDAVEELKTEGQLAKLGIEPVIEFAVGVRDLRKELRCEKRSPPEGIEFRTDLIRAEASAAKVSAADGRSRWPCFMTLATDRFSQQIVALGTKRTFDTRKRCQVDSAA